jgi:multiple sugar transport system substrate-binding protein
MKRLSAPRPSSLLGVAIVIVTLTALAASAVGARTLDGKSPVAATGAAKTTTVTLSGWASSPVETAALKKTIAAFERANKGIKVKYAPISGDYDAAMLAKFSARKPPDVFYVDSLDVPDYLPALEPLNKFIQKTHFNTKPFFPRLLGGYTIKGQIYGFPKDWSPLGLEGNPAMLTKAGIRTAPRTWAQFSSALQKLKSTNAVPGGAPACLSLDWARILAFVYQNGGSFLNASRTKAVVNSPANIATIKTYLGWLQSGLAKTPSQLGVDWCGEALGKEKAAFIFEGNWVYSYMQEQFPSVNFRVYPMVRNKAEGNLAFTASYSMGKFSKNKDAGWKLLSFLVSPQGQSVWSKNSGFLPARKDVKAPPGRAAFVKAAPAARPWQFTSGFQKVIDLAGNELTATFEGKQSVEAMMRKIQTAAAEAIKK